MDAKGLFPGHPTHLARLSHPETSKRAAEGLVKAGILPALQAETVTAVRAYPGHTASELERLCNVAGRHFGRRLPECVGKGIKRGPARMCGVTGHDATTWWPEGNVAT